jgi:hypothetical protein
VKEAAVVELKAGMAQQRVENEQLHDEVSTLRKRLVERGGKGGDESRGAEEASSADNENKTKFN